jgi:hypothetical protein
MSRKKQYSLHNSEILNLRKSEYSSIGLCVTCNTNLTYSHKKVNTQPLCWVNDCLTSNKNTTVMCSYCAACVKNEDTRLICDQNNSKQTNGAFGDVSIFLLVSCTSLRLKHVF